MALQELVARTTRRAPSAQMKEMFVAPTMLSVCRVCLLIRDETGSSPHRERWVTPGTYRRTHGMNPADFPLTHTHCLKCFTKIMDTTRQYFREIGTPP